MNRVTYAHDPNTQEAEEGKVGFWGHSQLHNKLQLGYMSPCLKKKSISHNLSLGGLGVYNQGACLFSVWWGVFFNDDTM